MSFHKRTGAAAPKRTLVCRAALALSAAAPLSAFAADDAASVPPPVTQELAPTVVREPSMVRTPAPGPSSVMSEERIGRPFAGVIVPVTEGAKVIVSCAGS